MQPSHLTQKQVQILNTLTNSLVQEALDLDVDQQLKHLLSEIHVQHIDELCYYSAGCRNLFKHPSPKQNTTTHNILKVLYDGSASDEIRSLKQDSGEVHKYKKYEAEYKLILTFLDNIMDWVVVEQSHVNVKDAVSERVHQYLLEQQRNY
jgi:hypothetical protein